MTIPQPITNDTQQAINSRRQSNLAAFGRRALTSVNFPQLVREGVELASTELGVEHGDVLELMSDGTLQLRATLDGRLQGDLPSIPLVEGTATAHALQTHDAVIIDEHCSESHFDTPSWQGPRGIASSVIVPLLGPMQP